VLKDPRLSWFHSEDIQPYVYVRDENRISSPGTELKLDWFDKKKPVYINPLRMDQVEFGNQILELEGRAFGPANMAMPRWVFYDCAITPGFVAGFCTPYEKLSEEMKALMPYAGKHDWVPLSLFIIIPTMAKDGEWVAHNLCTINSLGKTASSMYGLGFLSKAFGLWYANVKTCCGFTQWGNPAARLHSYYGPFEILTAYTPIHSHSRTLTYRVRLESTSWDNFFTKQPLKDFYNRFERTGKNVIPKDESSLKSVQLSLENKEGPFYLDSHEVLTKDLGEPLSIYKPKSVGDV
jgi:hypothetical protein